MKGKTLQTVRYGKYWSDIYSIYSPAVKSFHFAICGYDIWDYSYEGLLVLILLIWQSYSFVNP